MEDVKKILKGYSLFGSADNFLAIKNRFSPLGNILFHLSFFLILVGGLLTTYTRFTANLDLAEGEYFTGQLEQYTLPVRLPKIGSSPSVRFYVERIEPEVVNNVATDLRVYILDEEGKRHVIRINFPYKKDYTSFVIKNLGVAPLVILFDDKDNEIDGAYVKLNVLKGRQDSFILGGYTFNVRFYPDFYEKDGLYGTLSEEMKNPVFEFTITDKGVLKNHLIRTGEKLRVDNNFLLIPEFRYWVQFIVVRERGLSIVYAGFLIITIALIMRLVFYRREIRGIIDESSQLLRLGGRAEFYKNLFEEEFKKVKDSFSRSVQ
jgi:cytochrome c biogenesis protein ResB